MVDARIPKKLGMVVCAYSPSDGEAEIGGSLRPKNKPRVTERTCLNLRKILMSPSGFPLPHPINKEYVAIDHI